jgi:hypothetical protein
LFTSNLQKHQSPGVNSAIRLIGPPGWPVSDIAKFHVHPRQSESIDFTRVKLARSFWRNGAYRWNFFEDLREPNKFRMEVMLPPFGSSTYCKASG